MPANVHEHLPAYGMLVICFLLCRLLVLTCLSLSGFSRSNTVLRLRLKNRTLGATIVTACGVDLYLRRKLANLC